MSPGMGNLDVTTDTAGSLLRGITVAIGRLRAPLKPLHPRGVVVEATMRRHGVSPPTGVGWLDEPGQDEAVLRCSRAVGLPPPLPDILGMAIRFQWGQAPVDLLFATTGQGPAGRFVLLPRRAPLVAEAPYTTLLPYRGPDGPILLAARPRHRDGALELRLAAAAGRGSWQEFATVVGQAPGEHGSDSDIDFDPIRNALPDLPPYGWVRRLREPSYVAARSTRDAHEPPG